MEKRIQPSEPPILWVHGFGVRGFFWDLVLNSKPNGSGTWKAPDFSLPNAQAWAEAILEHAQQLRDETGTSVVVAGHSFGGIAAAVACLGCDTNLVSHLVIMNSPYRSSPAGLTSRMTGFLIRHRLLPGAAVRRRFFGPDISKADQTALFARAVPESGPLLALVTAPAWFHTKLFTRPLDQRVLGIGSESDRIVPADETETFSRVLGGSFHRIPKEKRIGHDDPAVSEEAAAYYIRTIREFTSLRERT